MQETMNSDQLTQVVAALERQHKAWQQQKPASSSAAYWAWIKQDIALWQQLEAARKTCNAQQDFEQVAATIRRWQAEGHEPQLMSLYQLLNQEPEPGYTITAKGRAYLAAVRS